MKATLSAIVSETRAGTLWITLLAALGTVVGLLLVPRLPAPTDPAEPPPEVRLLGERLVLDDGAPERALDAIRRQVSGVFQLVLPDQKSQAVSYTALGVAIDTIRMEQAVRDARDPTSPLSRTRRRLGLRGPIDLPVALVVDPDTAAKVLRKLKDEWDRPPKEARLDIQKNEVITEQNGLRLDIDETLGRLRDALSAGKDRVEVAFETLTPRRVAKDIDKVTFDHVLGHFETNYDRSNRAAARTHNLKIAASRLDGTVLLPGETFDFNEVVGPRDEAGGYQVAPVIAQGELVDGIGGGTCQISGTLHGAAFFAGLDIVERLPHTRPSSYIKMGLDATVVYPTINFRVRNPYDYAVVLHETVADGEVRAEVRGPKPAPTVTFIRRIKEAIPYQQLERPDPRLPRGTHVLAQRGVPGFKLRRYRIIRDGPFAERQRWDDVYPPTPQIVRIGTGQATGKEKKPAGDPHPEYLADELLVLTQTTEDGESVPKLIEDREPGRYGEEGWTKRAHMPYYEAE